MFSNIKTRASRALAVVSCAVLAAPAMAQSTFTVPAEVTDAKDAVLAVGAAVFAIAVGIKLYKWIKRAL